MSPTQSSSRARRASSELLHSTSDRLEVYRNHIVTGQEQSLVRLLPLFLALKGKPYTLDDHVPFEPLFKSRLSRITTYMTGRQVGKSNSMAAWAIMLCNSIPYFCMLFVTPLFEQVRRFSSQYVRPLIDGSPIKQHWVGINTENSVLRRTFSGGGRMEFNFSGMDPDRLRGTAASAVSLDEVQDVVIDHLPIIFSTMDGPNDWRLQLRTGTPKTLDNTLTRLWGDSSQAEWVILCPACKKLNIPSRDFDLIAMIGPYHPDISPERPGVICANASCQRPLPVRQGRWLHRYPERMFENPGYHVPQIVMPHHFEKADRWRELLGKQEGKGNYTMAQFYNEVLGEPYDLGTKLINETDLRRACVLPWDNVPRGRPTPEIISKARMYEFRVLAVDWGGGGEKGLSLTVAAVLAWNPEGKIDVLYGRRLLTPHDHPHEAEEILHMASVFSCQLICHDFTGAGSLRETLLIQAGISSDRIIPIAYAPAARQNIMVFKPPTEIRPRYYWQLDKTRSLLLVCTAIKLGLVRFFRFDRANSDEPGLISDFLSLIENKVETYCGDRYTIIRNPAVPDDFAQAVNIGCCTIWQKMGTWPDLASQLGWRATVDDSAHLPERHWDQDDLGGY